MGYKYSQKYSPLCWAALRGNCGWRGLLAATKETTMKRREQPIRLLPRGDKCLTLVERLVYFMSTVSIHVFTYLVGADEFLSLLAYELKLIREFIFY